MSDRELTAKEIEEAILSLRLDPAKYSTPHCIHEYNAGLLNAAEACRSVGGS